MSKLALLGGTPIAANTPQVDADLFHWPIVNDAMRKAQLDVLNDGNMSGTNISIEFEKQFAAWQGTRHALTHNTGTNALWAAMYGIGLGPGDEMICPSVTYWASCTAALTLGAAVVFCDIDPENLQLDPASVEARITPQTKAIMVVHYLAHPADMDAIMAIAKRHGLKVIEDVSHAQGGTYKGRRLGNFGDVAAMSLMSGKSFAVGEGGMLVTDDEEIYRRAIRFGHYDRIGSCYKPEEYADTLQLPVGGQKFRMHQVSAAIGIEQLKKQDAERAEIDAALKYFWKRLGHDLPGIRWIYPTWENSDKSGWYASAFHYDPEAFDGISNVTFVKAVNAELGGDFFSAGCNFPLHRSSLFYETDIFGHGRPTASLYLPEGTDLRALTGSLPVSEGINAKVIHEPWFKHMEPKRIDKYADAVLKVVENHKDLLDLHDAGSQGHIAHTKRK